MSKQRIASIAELKDLACSGSIECFILLNYGVISVKQIEYDGVSEVFEVHHCIDDTDETYTTKQLRTSNIGKAIRKGAFYLRSTHLTKC